MGMARDRVKHGTLQEIIGADGRASQAFMSFVCFVWKRSRCTEHQISIDLRKFRWNYRWHRTTFQITGEECKESCHTVAEFLTDSDVSNVLNLPFLISSSILAYMCFNIRSTMSNIIYMWRLSFLNKWFLLGIFLRF